jgi:transcriptional regulator PpsR
LKSLTARRFVEAAETTLQRAGGVFDARLTGTLAAGFDVALVLDRMGVVQDLAILSEDLITKPLSEQLQSWQGHAFSELVQSESRAKAVEIMRVVALEGHCKPRQLNFALEREGGLVLSVAATKLEHDGNVLLLCRDLRPMSRLQQQLVDAQQRVEREYARQRSIETRQQALFQLASEGMLVVEESSLRVIESNPAANELLSEPGKSRAGSRERINRALPEYFEAASKNALVAWLARLAREPSIGVFEGLLKHNGQSVIVRASLVRQSDGPAFMVTIRAATTVVAEHGGDVNHQILSNVFDGMPDALVVTDSDGRVMFANQSFVELVQFATQDQVRGASLSKWLSRAEVDVSLLIGTLKQHNVVRQYSTDIRGEFGSSIAVEIAGVLRTVNGHNCFGFAIRDVVRRPIGEAENDRFMPRSNDELRELVGRVPLKDIVAETSDLIERLCIETALELTGDNRAAAAEMLGLSRQSLYVKLRRYGVGYDEAGELVPDR